ncbi:MAG: nitroreductase family protein [Tepidiformaceae bacterium]
MSSLLEPLSRRRARRSFSSALVSQDDQLLLWQALSVAPSHGNSQPTRVLVASSAEARERLIGALSEGNRQWAPAAPLLFALAAVPGHDAVQANSDGTGREMWAFHAGIAMGNLLAQATASGLVAHPMAGFDEPAVRDAFGAPGDVRILAVVAAGHPGPVEALPEDLQRAETRPQDRIPFENLLGIDRWNDEMGVSARDLRKRVKA